MKRIILLVALAVIFAVAIPALAGPYSDVPASHWAYDALNKLSSTGLITGFPDGTYKGNQNLTRYQIAVLVGRVLDAVEAETALLDEKIEAVENGLTAGQAEDVIAIFKSLLAKYSPEVEVPENLTATQAEEVAGIVEALSLEFKFELEAMGKDVDSLLERMDAVEGRVDALEVVTWSGSYDIVLDKTNIWGDNAYIDPFTLDNGTDDDPDDDMYAAADDLYHELGLGMAIATDNLTASFDVAVVNDDFIAETPGAFELADLYATVNGDNFTAVAGREQEVIVAPYLFGMDADDQEYSGIKLTIGNDVYGLFRDAGANVFVGQHDLGILDSTLYFGMNDIVDSTDFIAGINTPFDILGIDLTTDVAVQKIADEYAPYVTLNAKKTLGFLTLEGNYNYVDENFVGLYADSIELDGYDVRADLALLDGNLNANGRYYDHEMNKYGFGADATFGPLTANFDMDFRSQDALESERTQYGAELTSDILFLNVVAGYQYDEYTDGIGGQYVDDDDEALDMFNRVYGDLTADLFIPGLTATANYVYGLGDIDVDGTGLSTHAYGLAYEQGILTAGFDYDMVDEQAYANAGVEFSIFTAGLEKGLLGDDDTLTAYATVDPEAYDILGVNVDTKAGFEMEATNYNYNVDLDLSKQISEKATLSYGYLYDNREIEADNALTGLKIEQTAAIDYAITADLSATLAYTNLYFDDAADTDVDSYHVEQLTTGLSLSF